MAQSRTYMVQQPTSVRPVAYQDDYGYAMADTATGAATKSPSAQPSGAPPAPPAANGANPEPPKEEAKKDDEKKDEEKKDEEPKEEGPYELFPHLFPCLECRHIDMRGYIEGGATFGDDHPVNKLLQPMGYNDRDGEMMLNQLYFITERVTKVENDCGSDWGFRVDTMFGTDRRYVQVNAESGWDGEINNGQKYYGLIFPQAYFDVAVDKWLFRLGHMLAPVGQENVMPTENFFYSHTYAFLYGEPTTLTAAMASYKLSDRWTLNSGIDTGWNDFDSLSGKVNFFFGGNWNSKDGNQTLAIENFLGNTQLTTGIDSTRYLLNLVFTQKIGKKWQYAAEGNVAYDNNTPTFNSPAGGHASWAGIAQYLTYQINDCWAWGLRYELFDDWQGAVVTQVNDLAPPALAGGRYNAATMGLKWTPNKNVIGRTELRYDWVDTNGTPGALPFHDNNNTSQFTWGNDIVIRF